ncbi:MAG TPA: hypothetical protein VK709_16545 [Candidatus Saccharimonadales bacterium]|nr:hypothetical protein [Candidatus Saccharimonadales bacterium]
MTTYPFTVAQIVSWFRLKQRLLEGSSISVDDIRERKEYLPAVAADFVSDGIMGRINGWVSGEFDFEVIRVSDGMNLYSGHAKVSALGSLESAYMDFLQQLINTNSAEDLS